MLKATFFRRASKTAFIVFSEILYQDDMLKHNTEQYKKKITHCFLPCLYYEFTRNGFV